MEAVLIFDADNTLWDTDSVFRSAQLALLGALAKAGLVTDPESRVEELRILDQELISQMVNFEYDFRLLSVAAAYFYSRALTVKEAVHEAISHPTQSSSPELSMAIEDAYQAFLSGLKETPCLYPDTEAVLSSIRVPRSSNNSVATVLFSEGDPRRLERILRLHEIRRRGFFDEIIIETKSREAFEKAKQAGLNHLPKGRDFAQTLAVLIGDSLQRDIKFGNQAGFVTVYKPSAFKGEEEPRELDERPHYTIGRLGELLSVLRSLGFPI